MRTCLNFPRSLPLVIALATASCGGGSETAALTSHEHTAEAISALIASQQAKLTAADATNYDRLGTSVGVSGDTAVAGAPWDAVVGPYSGSAYVFVRTAGVWTQQAKLTPADPGQSDYFGEAVAISGETIAVTAPRKNIATGAAYVFVRSGGVWTEQAKIVAADAVSNDHFGSSVALWADTVLIGSDHDDDGGTEAGSAYVFVRSGNSWTQEAKLVASDGATNHYFGRTTALSGDTAVVGAPEHGPNGAGSVYVFVRNGSAWTEQAMLAPPGLTSNDNFGSALSLSGDLLAAGSHYEYTPGSAAGAVHVFARSGSVWTEEVKLSPGSGGTNYFGSSAAIEGERLAVGSQTAGVQFVFERLGGTWPLQAILFPKDGPSNSAIGASIALSGNTVIAGAPQDDDKGLSAGSAYVFVLTPGGTTGSTCAGGVDCTSGFCTDGVCCDSACGGGDPNDCQACSISQGAPSDGACSVLPASTVCRASAGVCDAVETCDGLSAVCLPDAFAPIGQLCRAAAGDCDVPETCGGTADCPADTLAPPGFVCRAAAGGCDVAETCDGVTALCAADSVAPADTGCRAAAGPCDIAELCDGASKACPSDAFAADGVVCPGGECLAGMCLAGGGGSGGSGGGSSGSGGASSGTGGMGGAPAGAGGMGGSGDSGSPQDDPAGCGCRVAATDGDSAGRTLGHRLLAGMLLCAFWLSSRRRAPVTHGWGTAR